MEQKSGDLTIPSPSPTRVKKRTGEEGRNGEEEGQMHILTTLMSLSWTMAIGNFKNAIAAVHDI